MFRALLLTCLLLLASCGFQLQGASTAPDAMARTYIDTTDRHSLFYRQLTLQLQAAGVEVVDSPSDASATLSILLDETDQRVLSVSARNVPTEYEVFYTVEYSLGDEQESLLEPQLLTLTRDYTFDATLVLGKAHEEEMLREALAKDLVRVVLKQLATL